MSSGLRNILFFLYLILLVCKSAFAHVELTYPEGGETFYTNDTIIIKWVETQAHDAQNWELYFSPDAGENWQAINTNIPVAQREYAWIIPTTETNRGRVRVVQNNSETDYQDFSGNFSIEIATGVGEENNYSSVFDSFYHYPNPLKTKAIFSFTLKKKEKLSIVLYAFDGSKVAEIVNAVYFSGDQKLVWDASALDIGIYFYAIRMGDAMRLKKLQIVR